MRQPCVLLKYGELALKGRNRGRFERRLAQNLRRALDTVEGGDRVRVRPQRGVLVLTAPGHPECVPAVLERVREVVGLSVVQPALRVERTVEAAGDAALELARAARPGGGAATFAMRVRRRSKDFPLRSPELARVLGARVQEELGWPVDLRDPAVEIAVEVDQDEIFVSGERYRGQGGLPVGSSGRALALLSGGFDSPVAAHRAMRRGLRCDFVHFTGAPLTGPSSAYKAYALARELTRFGGDCALYVIPLGKAQRALATAGAGGLQVVAQRRLMVRTADRLAARLRADALVTGDSLGQVSSQTLSNLAAVERAAERPLLRPLLAMDKEEIMAEADRIGTSAISRLPDEDCCSLLMPPSVATRTDHTRLARIEGRLDMDEVVDELLAQAQVLKPGRTEGSAAPDSDSAPSSGSSPDSGSASGSRRNAPAPDGGVRNSLAPGETVG